MSAPVRGLSGSRDRSPLASGRLGMASLSESIDRARLESLRSYTDHRRGITESFVSLDFGGRPGVGVLSVPIVSHREVGWVICHSFGMEQTYLQPLEVAVARSLVANGFPVLRFQGRGYGDSDAPIEEVGLESHVADAADAFRAMMSAGGVARLGLIGARFGGAVAALVADRLGASALVLLDPAVSGKAYLNSIIRARLVAELADQGRASATARDPWEVLDEQGLLEVDGFPLTRRAFDEISLLDVAKQLSRFTGEALVVQVSRSPRPSPGLRRLLARFGDLGASAKLEVVADPEATRFGLPRYRLTGDASKVDTQERLSATLIERTVAWCSEVSGRRVQEEAR